MNSQSVFKNSKYLEVTYSQNKAPYGGYPALLCDLIASKYFGKKEGRLLELGCGRGDHINIFAKMGYDARGVDISPLSPELACGCEIKVADLERDELPYPSGSFDFVFSKSVIEHMRNPSCLMSKAYDALCPGGTAVIMTPSWEYTYWGPFYIDHTHVTPFTLPSLKDALEISGFKDVEVEYFYQLPFIWKFPFLKFVSKLIAVLPLPFRPFKKAPWPDNLNKLIRFSKEVMLVAVARKI